MKYQVWLHGSSLAGHVWADSRTEAERKARDLIKREYPDEKRPGICISPIEEDYYKKLAESNRRQGFCLETGD